MMELYKNRNWLYQKYREEKLSTIKIAQICNVCNTTIGIWLKKLKIPTAEKGWKAQKRYREIFICQMCGKMEKGTVSLLINENIFKYGIIACEKCKKDCENNYHIDHIIPISKDGTNDYENLQILCAHCNLSKHDNIADYRQNIEDNQLYLRI